MRLIGKESGPSLGQTPYLSHVVLGIKFGCVGKICATLQRFVFFALRLLFMHKSLCFLIELHINLQLATRGCRRNSDLLHNAPLFFFRKMDKRNMLNHQVSTEMPR
jgi:hypothetical protein